MPLSMASTRRPGAIDNITAQQPGRPCDLHTTERRNAVRSPEASCSSQQICYGPFAPLLKQFLTRSTVQPAWRGLVPLAARVLGSKRSRGRPEEESMDDRPQQAPGDDA